MAIQSFRCKHTAALFRGLPARRFPGTLLPVARRKLQQLDAAGRVEDLRVPPGNQLEPLKGDRKGQHSIRINGQWRICFVWGETGPERVEIVDYH